MNIAYQYFTHLLKSKFNAQRIGCFVLFKIIKENLAHFFLNANLAKMLTAYLCCCFQGE